MSRSMRRKNTSSILKVRKSKTRRDIGRIKKGKPMGKIHLLTIRNPEECPTFDLIKSGKKTVEGRKNNEKYQEYKVGDYINFYCDKQRGCRKKEYLLTKITKINKYKTVEEYLRTETLKKALPCVKTIKEGVKLYNLFSSQSERNALRKKYGHSFLGIHIKLH